MGVMCVFDGSKEEENKNASGFKVENDILKLGYAYLTNHIKKFSDLYINEYLRLYADCVHEIDISRNDSVMECSRKISK